MNLSHDEAVAQIKRYADKIAICLAEEKFTDALKYAGDIRAVADVVSRTCIKRLFAEAVPHG